jgi:hypothetical protein
LSLGSFDMVDLRLWDVVKMTQLLDSFYLSNVHANYFFGLGTSTHVCL